MAIEDKKETLVEQAAEKAEQIKEKAKKRREKRKKVLAARREAVPQEMVNRLWIEFDERHPEPDALILVTLADGSVDLAKFNGLTWTHPYNNAHVYEDVVAWQPLPEPYVEQEVELEEKPE